MGMFVSGSLTSTGSFGDGRIANNVGIGTTVPIGGGNPNLSLYGTGPYINLTETDFGGSNTQAHIDYSNMSLNLVNEHSGSIKFYTSSSLRMTITGSGNVGIGTAAPAYQFVVNGPAGSDGNIVADTTDTSGGSSDAKLGLAKGGTIKWWLMNDGSQSDKFYLQDEGGAQAITVQQDGKVGIGVGATDVVAGNFQCVGNGYFTSGTGDTNGVFIGTGNSVGMISSNTSVD